MANQSPDTTQQIFLMLNELTTQQTALKEQVTQMQQNSLNLSAAQLNGFLKNIECLNQNWGSLVEYQQQLQRTVEGIQPLYVQLSNLLQQSTSFEMEIRHFKESNEGARTALQDLVGQITEHQNVFQRLAKDLGHSITHIDKQTQSFLEERQKQFAYIFDTTLEYLNNFFRLEKEVFMKGFENARKIIDEQNLLHPLENLKYLPLIYEQLKSLNAGDAREDTTTSVSENTSVDNEDFHKLLYAEPAYEGVFHKTSVTQNNKSYFCLKISKNGIFAKFQFMEEKAAYAIKLQEDVLQEACEYQNSFYQDNQSLQPKTKIKGLEQGEAVFDQGKWQITKKAMIEFYD